jgi:hypothetical protein
MAAEISYVDVNTPNDIGTYIETYRGSGIEKILEDQIEDQCKINIDVAFSALGKFLDQLIEHHRQSHSLIESKDHFIYSEIKNMVEKMIKDPKFDEYENYLQTKLDALDNSINQRKQG